LTPDDFLTNSSYTLKDLENGNEQDWTEEQMHLDIMSWSLSVLQN
jgi:hypothetical protein